MNNNFGQVDLGNKFHKEQSSLQISPGALQAMKDRSQSKTITVDKNHFKNMSKTHSSKKFIVGPRNESAKKTRTSVTIEPNK